MLDRQLLGLQGLACIQGEPKANKSTLALQIALENLQLGNPVYIYDKENGEATLGRRLLCALAKMSPSTLGRLSTEDLEKLRLEKDRLPLFVCHENLNFEELAGEVEKVIASYPSSRTLLIVDSIQALTGKTETKRHAIDEWLHNFDALKLKHPHKLVTLLISEKNRSSYGIATKAGGKESGTIEYKCEQVFDMRVDEESGLINFDCVANRHGINNIHTKLEPVYDQTGKGFTFTLKEVGIDL
jgi:KaiC/GvpD/RAD55 family RecA-like ATPase